MHERIEKFKSILEKELKKELDRINSSETLNPADIKTVTDAVRLMLKIKEYEEFEDSVRYSRSENGYSNRRGRSSVTGRYMSRDHMPMDSYRGSYDSGYSGHSIKDRMIDKLESMYDEAQSNHERQMVDEWIDRLSTSR